MAAPHVSGTAALVCAQFPNITMQKLRSIVMYGGHAAPWQFNNVLPLSTGRAVDASKALDSVNSPDVTAPGAVANLSVQITDGFPNYQLIWQAPGDDGNVGKVGSYEVRFSETSLNEANYDLATPLPGPVPGDPGFTQFVEVKVPWRHPSTFRFFNIDYTSVTVSTNGALYFGFPSDNDPFGSVRWLSGTRMIAGLWDDLRTDKRPGDDVYTIQDQDRIIFRWQAVTFDNPISPTTTRGENPVSFEIELRFDGTITVRFGDGNQKTLPVVGIGGGSPEPYVSTSHTFSTGLKDLPNAPVVVFARRNPNQRGVLTVASSNPTSGVDITVSPNDISGLGNGTTQFTRTYNPGTTVTLTAPATFNGNNFKVWLRDGEGWSGLVTTTVVMNGNHTMTAVYST